MKPKTAIQKEVIRLSAALPGLTGAQRTYAFRHCFKHYGRRTAKGVITCTECGHAWKSGHSLATVSDLPSGAIHSCATQKMEYSVFCPTV